MPSILLGCCTTDHALPVGQGCRTHRSSTCKPHSHTLICAESSRPFLPVKLISSGLATCSLQPFSCQSRADASSSSSKGGQSTLSSAGKIPYRHMLRHHVSWRSARWGSPYWRTGYFTVPFTLEVVLMDNMNNIVTNWLRLQTQESALKTDRNPEQHYKEHTQVDEWMEVAVILL